MPDTYAGAAEHFDLITKPFWAAVSPAHPVVPLLQDRPAPKSGALAYVCRGMVCSRPVADEAGLLAELQGRPAQD